ncbi:methyl-accepting chemotaxis protein [Pseudotabrizicola algicola]|uniref:Methyl-accepting chemotaxis protein n=1 Tax=Pseudotabrizicola algicola TaxID=2709381 RepID=A0A6B3RL56_9RHOB|nr:methyl-accepting chemotaxis protein [Pseudotabrizicola algicola]NEX46161.1 methyl-accepting chemotaxis protein [Pseudotabrizicola algicola]
MTYAPPVRTRLASWIPSETLTHALGLTETCFLEAGDSLAHAVNALHETQSLFARLEQTLGDETGAHLAQLIAKSFANVDGLRADFDRFLHQSLTLRLAVRNVRAEVNELDRVVRTISSVSVNARILGNALTPPSQQVNSFVERLAQMSSEAETILREVKGAMAGIGQDTDMMDETLQELSQHLRQQVLPAIARFATVAQKVQDGRTEMSEVSARLAAQMKTIFNEVSQLIIALQTGDSTRQRLERVKDVLGNVPASGPSGPGAGLAGVLIRLARALTHSARQDALAEVDLSITALDVVRRNADHAMQSARQFYFSRAGRRSDGAAAAESSDGLDDGLERVRRHLLAMHSRAEALGGRLDVIMKHEVRIRQIAQHIRLSGLNAVLVCAKLGEEGRSLRELAQWLRALTDESDAIVLRLQGHLAETRTRTDEAARGGVQRLEGALSGFVGDAEKLNTAMTLIKDTVTETAHGFDKVGKILPVYLGVAGERLTRFRASLDGLAEFTSRLDLLGAVTAGPSTPFAEGSEELATLSRLRSRYTAQQDRMTHDSVVAAFLSDDGSAQADRPVAAPAPRAAAAEEALDDILF